jgi:hypothetical protein
MAERYPLSWPAGWRRTVIRAEARFARETHSIVDGVRRRTGRRELSVSESHDRVLRELRAMGVYDSVISTNLKLTSFGTPRSKQSEPKDPGAAVYWEKGGKPQCMAIDQYDRVADNLAAIAASLEALRAIERHGGAQIMERAFLGFAALPASVSKPWREVFGLQKTFIVPLGEHGRAVIEDLFRSLAKTRHPDRGGDQVLFQEIVEAREAAVRELQ